MNRATPATGWVRNPTMKSPDLDPHLASSYELGYTWNPITGCLNGCSYCYARWLANGRLKQRYLANKNTAPTTGNILLPNLGFVEMNPFYPRFWPERLMEPLHLGKGQFGLATIPRGVFVCDMSDLFGIGIPEEWTKRVMDTIKDCPQHRFYTLTKQPQELPKWEFPDNCWVGVTATNSWMFSNAVYWLSQIEAKVKYLSLEPLQERILPHYIGGFGDVQLVIIGSQTKPYRPPEMSCVQEIVSAAARAGTSVFLKDNLLELVNYVDKRTEFAFNKEGYYRQEMPK